MIQFFNEDGDVFFQYEGLPVSVHYIYIIPILLGVIAIAAVSVIAIIYFRRKKKRL